MKKLFTTGMLALLFIIANGQPLLYGLTSNGGSNGTISRYEAAANTLSASFNFPDINSRPQGSLMQANDGKLYGMTQGGGINGIGTLFSFDPVLSVHTKLLDFNGANGSYPQGSLIQANNGKLYGMTNGGGVNNLGVIFSFDAATSAYVKLKDFDEPSGNRPGGSLLQASDGKLYGLTYTGGIVGTSSYGTLFSLDPVTNIFTRLKIFDFISGAYPVNSLMQYKDGKLYGMTAGGGAIGGIRHGYGVIFSFDPITLVYTKLKDFDGTNGGGPSGDLVSGNDGKLYGMTPTGAKADGSTGDFDVLFSFDPLTSAYTKLRNFVGVDGDSPYGSLVLASNNKLYGMTSYGGVNYMGVVFSYDPVTGVYSKLQDFDGSNGRNPYNGALIEVRTITTGPLAPKYCAGSSIPIAYTTTGAFWPANIFTAQLSNPAGSFANPVNIGSINSATSGIINAVLPPSTAAGSAYRIRVVANFPATTGNDNGSDITIDTLPVLALAPFGDICVSDPPFVLTGGAPAGGVYSGKGVTNNQFDPAVGVGTYTITYTFKNNAGCTATVKQAISVVKPCNACKATITANGATTFCQGGKVTLTVSNGVRYLWSNGATTQAITVSTTGSYSVKVTDANKCSAVSMPVAVTVNALPAAPVISAGSSTVFCIPASVTLATGPAYSYLWSSGATTQSTTVSASGIYAVTVTNAAGCSAVSPGISVTAMNCIKYCGAEGNINKRGYIQKVVTSNGINNNSGWNNGYGNFTYIAGSSSQGGIFDMVISPGFTSTSSKLYTKVWIDWNQNGDFNDAGDLVFAPPNASDLDRTTTIAIPKNGLTGYTTMRVLMSSDANTSWCGSFKYGEVEDYTILISASGARMASLPSTGNTNKLMAQTGDYNVFPNPASDRIQIQQSVNKNQLIAGSNTLVQLTDAGGQVLMQTRLQSPQQYIDVSRFSNGIYFLHIKSSNTSTVKKIFIQHQ